MMRTIYNFFISLLAGFLLTLSLSVSAHIDKIGADNEQSEQSVSLGVLAYRDKAQTIERWQPLADYLTQQIPGFRFHLIAGNYPSLEQEIQQKNLDFILTQPSHYVALTYSKELSSPLASMVNKESQNGYALFGGVIFTKKNREDINSLVDIQGKTIVTPSKKSLGAYQMQAYELLDKNVFSQPADIEVLETGLPQSNAVEAVLQDKADVGFVRSGVIEKLINKGVLQADQIKIINPKTFKDFNFAVSTRLYPEWPIASFSHVKPDLVKQLLVALLKIDRDGELANHLQISGFTIAEDYRKIDELLRTLHLPPFDAEKQITLMDIWERWQHYIALFMSVIILMTSILLLFLWKKNLSLKELTYQLQKSNEQNKKLELAIQQSPVRVMMTNSENQIEYANHAVLSQTGYSLEEIFLKDPRILASGETPKSVYDELWSTILRGDVWSGEIINSNKNGENQVLKTTITQIHDQALGRVGYLSIQKDITLEKESEKAIHQLSFYDELTGLPNRNKLEGRVNELMTHYSEQNFLLLLNIDRFKVINDANGKQIGDEFLKDFAQMLCQALPDNSTVSRFAADEFAIVLSLESSSDLQHQIISKAQALLDKIKKPFSINNQMWNITASIGIAPISKIENSTFDQVLRHADTALHFAKSEGGNQVQLFNAEIEKIVLNNFQIEQDIKTALQDGQFELFYQPQVSLTGQLTGAEALIRWQHPEKGMISPDTFIPIAEQTDLIVDIGKWVIQNAFVQFARAIKDGFEYELSVNISPRQFMETGFENDVIALVNRTGIPQERITLEITEGLFINNLQQILPVMQKLSDFGFKFSIDDFGTGFSSLSYLKYLPINELKIDRIFVTHVATDSNDAMLVDTIISIAEHMRCSIVAEGIETSEQAQFFNRFPNIRLQGYKYGKPTSFEEFEQGWHK